MSGGFRIGKSCFRDVEWWHVAMPQIFSLWVMQFHIQECVDQVIDLIEESF